MAAILKNNAKGKLAAALTASATALSLQGGQGALFPSPTGGDFFPLTIIKPTGELEIVYCTKRVGDVLTVTRAREGTSAKAFSTGDRCSLRFTAGVWDSVSQLASRDNHTGTQGWETITGAPAQATRWPTLAEVTGKPANYPTNWATVSNKPIVQTTGASTTNLMSQKAVTDALGQPSITGSCTTNGATDNTLVLGGIVSALALEIGDVIRIQYSGYDKLHTVESITNNGSIIVNYEHAGNRANGSLKLPNFTGQATVTRIAKWFNAPMGLGQAWVNMSGRRSSNTNYENGTNRAISFAVSFAGFGPETKGTYVNGLQLYGTNGDISITQERIIPPNAAYKFIGPLGSLGATLQELR